MPTVVAPISATVAHPHARAAIELRHSPMIDELEAKIHIWVDLYEE